MIIEDLCLKVQFITDSFSPNAHLDSKLVF